MSQISEQSSLEIYLKQISKIPLITVQEEIELAEKIANGDEKAREKMITSNLRLVVKIAQDYSNIGLSLLDLINEGNIGLMKAVERFDPSKGGKLSTYASCGSSNQLKEHSPIKVKQYDYQSIWLIGLIRSGSQNHIFQKNWGENQQKMNWLKK